MRIELRVCQHCLDGDHGNERRTALLNDMVDCAEQIKTHKEVIDLEAVHIRKVRDDEQGSRRRYRSSRRRFRTIRSS